MRLILITALLFSSLFALENGYTVKSDSTQKSYDIKYLFPIIETRKEIPVTALIQSCSIDKKGKETCYDTATWDYIIESDRFLGDSFFKGFFSKDRILPAAELTNISDLSVVKSFIQKNINTQHNNTEDKEENTFSTTKAKFSGINSASIKELLNNYYAAEVSIQKIKYGGKIYTTVHKWGDKTVIMYTMTMKTVVSTNLNIYYFDPDKEIFKPYRTEKIATSYFENLISEKWPEKVSDDLFKKHIEETAFGSGYNNMMEVHTMPEFRLYYPIKSVDGDNLETKKNAYIPTDTAFKIVRYIDNKESLAGYAKYRNNNFELIAGEAEPGDRLQEHDSPSWHFLFFGGETSYKNKPFITAGAGFSGNIGKIFDSGTFSETWIETSFEKGYLPEAIGKKQKIIYSRLGISVEKRFYFSGIYFAPCIGFHGEGTQETLPEKNMTDEEKEKYKPNSISLRPGVVIGKSFSPKFEIFLKAGEPIILSKKNSSFVPYIAVGVSGGF